MALTHYAFEKVICLFGTVPIVGFFEGDDVISVERSVPTFTMPMGAGGDGIAVQAADRSGIITVKLLQTSPSNLYLSGLLEAAEQGLFVAHPFLLKDAGTNLQLVAASQCVIQQPTKQVYGANHTPREWSFSAEHLVMVA